MVPFDLDLIDVREADDRVSFASQLRRNWFGRHGDVVLSVKHA